MSECGGMSGLKQVLLARSSAVTLRCRAYRDGLAEGQSWTQRVALDKLCFHELNSLSGVEALTMKDLTATPE